MLLQPLGPAVEFFEIWQPFGIATGNVVQGLLHLGGEPKVHKARKVLLQQRGDRNCRERGDQLRSGLAGVAAILNCVDDAGVGAGAADSFAFKGLHQCGFGVACRRLGLVANRLKV
ncbi:MAG: hypothetical protein DYG96_07625, partial [Chlorobi bacterium CHB2]|nr:hypothetical protein [Chlorobi bacterium CHB2]